MSTNSGTDRDTKSRIERCEGRIGYVFADKEILVSALTHASGADHRLGSNERLEFLGDAILGFVICEELYRRFPQYREGELTKIKSAVVSRRTCAKVSRELNLDELMILGKGMATGDAVPSSLYSDVFEALIAAVHLDGGMQAASDFVRRHLTSEIDAAVAGESSANHKSILQQIAQRMHGHPPQYHLLEESGPDHCKVFQVAAEVGKTTYTSAWGRNKKEAEQRAAADALAEMDHDLPPYAEPPDDFEFEETDDSNDLLRDSSLDASPSVGDEV